MPRDPCRAGESNPARRPGGTPVPPKKAGMYRENLLAGSLIFNSLDLLTTWLLCGRCGTEEANALVSAIISHYGFVVLAFYKGWAISGLLVVLYLCSTRNWRGNGFALLVFTSVTILLSGVVAWNGLQILTVSGLHF